MSEITLGRYLFERLKQVNVTTIFGLPGDFNLALLDKIYEVPGMRWVGNANELNAAYAADGYSRVKGLACMITTFGVGELSALNGVAGAYAEHVGVIHVVGTPSVASQAKHLLLHHTLGNGDFTVFHRMSANISETTAMITDIATAPAEIDRLIRTCYIVQRPVYMGLPSNIVDLKVPASLLDTPIDMELKPNDPEAEGEAIEEILSMIRVAKNPVILADACCYRYHCTEETEKLIEVTQFPAFVTPMGKGSINEQGPRFGGVYVGTLSRPEVKKAVESSDLVLSVGSLLSDFNTGSFSYAYSTKNVVEFHSDYTKIRNATFPGVQMKYALRTLIERVGDAVKDYKPVALPPKAPANEPVDPSTPLKQEWMWNEVGNFFRENDIILTETGTSSFGINQAHYSKGALGISQVLWGSIGYTGGAVLGASFAAEEQDPNRRVIVFIGDGSLQLTVQELSTILKWNLKPYVFVLNNNGYTIEKLIHGPHAQYNEIQPWRYLMLLEAFGGKDCESVRVSTVGDWKNIVESKEFAVNNKCRLIELMLGVFDAPSNLVEQAKITAAINAKQD